MNLWVRILAAAAGVGAAVGAVVWAKKHFSVEVDVKPDPETPEEEAELDALEAEAEAKTEEELKASEGNAVLTALALAKGWLRRHICVVKVSGEESADEAVADTLDDTVELDVPQAADAPAEAPAPAEAAAAEEGGLDTTSLAEPENLAD